MYQFNPQEKRLAITLAVVATAAIVYLLVVAPALADKQTLRQKEADIQVRWTKMQADLAMQTRVQASWEQIKDILSTQPHSAGTNTAEEKTDNGQQQLAQFTRELAELYSPLEVQINSVNVMPILYDQYYRKLSAQIVMEGSVHDMVRFLQAVAQAQSPLRLHRIQFTCQDRPGHIRAGFAVSKIVAP